ncbi:MAG: galactokinase [Thermoguttaceae bacterium]|nr:galactokinase [Thermoguttaceae bacterium]
MQVSPLAKSAVNEYISRYGTFPTALVAAPGRVNLIGEHTDYNGGFVFPLAIERYTVIAAGPKEEDPQSPPTATFWTDSFDEEATIPLDRPVPPEDKVTWMSYVAGTVAGCLEKGMKASSFNAVIRSDVPLGGGLSSSASLEVAVATLMEKLSGSTLEGPEKALLCQHAEHAYAHMPCGIMDQFISAMAREDHVMLLDCRSQETTFVPMSNPDIVVLVTNTNVKHQLSGSEYPERRHACEEVAKILGVPLLRDTTLEALEAAKERILAQENGEVMFRRARHFLTEEIRTRNLCEAMLQRNWKTVGQQMYAGHQSLRDDYQVSCPELDYLVNKAYSIGLNGGMIGSRMTGGGFGGCTVSLVFRHALEAVQEALENDYFARTGIHTTSFATRPAAGAMVLPTP